MEVEVVKLRRRLLSCLLATAVTVTSITPITAAASQGDLQIGSLKVNYLSEPLGIDDSQPVFSWILASDGYDKGQSAYRIVVSSTREGAERHEGDVWDSGKNENQNNYNITYQGNPLLSRTPYYWAVQVWDEEGNDNGWSKVSSFETGIMSTDEWNGEWIGIKNTDMNFQGANWIWRRDGSDFSGAPEGVQYFRKGFKTDKTKTISNVNIGITADDEYELFVNGQKAGENGGEDSWKNGKLYDITNLISAEGENVIAASAHNTSRGYAGLLAKIEVLYNDGTKDTYVTDNSWKLSKTKEEGWSDQNYNDTGWTNPDQSEPYGNSPWNSGVAPNAENAFAATVLRKEFKMEKGAIKDAKAYVSGLGFFELKINGQLPDDTLLNPANTQYNQTSLYRVFDVTELVKEGKNAIGVELGNSFYNETCSVWNWQDASWRDAPKLRMELEIEYENGEKESVVTDDSWKATKEGPITTNSIYYGETYDARKELNGFDLNDYDDTNWGAVQLMDAPEGKLKAQIMEPVRRTKEMQPSEITKLENGSYVLTIPEMLAGWIKLDIKGANAGDKVTITYGEKLNDDGQVQKLGGKDGVNSGWWPRAYNQQDNYICKGGKDVETFEPKFSYKGYQYVQIDGYPSELTADDVICYRVSNDMEDTGSFESSDELFNKMHQMMITTMKNNMQGKPTDTPVWEKNGWLGDANVALETMTYNFGFVNMLKQFVETMEDCQNEFNNVPNMVPTQGWGNDNTVVWNSIFVFGVDQMIDTYGNESYLYEQYDAMRKLALKDMEESRKNGWTWSDGQLADWVSPMGQGDADQDLQYSESPSEGSGICGTAFAYHLLDVMSQLADRMGKTDDAAEYRAAMEKMYTAFNEKFYDAENQIYRTLTWSQQANRSRYRQTSQLVPLAYGLVPEEYKDGVLTNLVNDIKDKNYHLDTGCVGSKFILPVLTDNGYADVAYKVAQQKSYPSWGFMADRGTSLWEMWETSSRSLGHYFLGTYDEWFYKGIGGIKDMQDGYKTVTIEPSLNETLTYAKAGVNTVRGQLQSDWTLNEGQGVFDIQVPVGTTAEIILPTNNKDQITCNGQPLSESLDGIHAVSNENGKVHIEAGSGNYKFETNVKLTSVEKIKLKKAILDAGSLKQLDYEMDAWTVFKAVLEEASELDANPDAAQEEIDAMVKKLTDAAAELKLHVNQSRVALKEAVKNADEKVNPVAAPIKYADAYQEAYDAAKAGCTNVELTNEEMDQLVLKLSNAETEMNSHLFQNLALNGNVAFSTSHEDGYWGWGSKLINDGDRKNMNKDGEYTGYSSNTGDVKNEDHEEWVSIDLGKVQDINAVSIYPAVKNPAVKNSGYGFPKNFEIQVSENGSDWTTVVTKENYPVPSYEPISFTFASANAKYVKLFAKNLNPKANDHNFYYLQLSEFEVYHSENTIEEIVLADYEAPKSAVAYGEPLVDMADIKATINGKTDISGKWSVEMQDETAADVQKNPETGKYNVKLTFQAPNTYAFSDTLAGTAADGAKVSVEDNGKKLVYTYVTEVVKAAAPAVEDKEEYFVYAAGGEGQVSIADLMEKYQPFVKFAVGNVTDEFGILDSKISIDEKGNLSFTVNTNGEAGQTAVIPVTVTMKNYEDTTVNVCVSLTEKIPLEITSNARNVIYTGSPYAGLDNPSAVIKETLEAYTGEFIITYNTEDGSAPVKEGNYTVTVTPEDPAYAGQWTGSFTISPALESVEAQIENPELFWDEDTQITGVAAIGSDGNKMNLAGAGIVYRSEDSNIAIVDENGKVSARNAGSTKIIVTITIGEMEKSGEFAVTVSEIPAISPVLASKTTTSVTLETVEGYEYAVQKENEEAAFSHVAEFKELEPGTSYKFYQRIAATDTHYAGSVSEVLEVSTDKEKIQGTITIKGNTKEGEKLTLDTTGIKNKKPGDLSITWKRGNQEVKGENGNTYALTKADVGYKISAVVTAKNLEGSLTTETALSVLPAVTPPPAKVDVDKVTLNKSSVSIKIKKTVKLTAQISPSNAADKSITWKSSKSSIASVDKNGKVTAKKAGKATITAIASNGKSASCKITVTTDPAKIKLNTNKKTLGRKETYTLKTTLVPSTAVTSKIIFTSSNKKVATVDKKGRVKALKEGTAVITVRTANGKKATCNITVKKAPSSIKLNVGKKKNLKIGKTLKLKVTRSAGSAGNVTFISKKDKVATVSSSGKIKAIKKGKAKIIAKTFNGKTAEVLITVK